MTIEFLLWCSAILNMVLFLCWLWQRNEGSWWKGNNMEWKKACEKARNNERELKKVLKVVRDAVKETHEC